MRKRVLIPVAIFAVIALAIFIFLPMLNHRPPQKGRVRSAFNLREIGIATIMYANEYGNTYPATPGNLLIEDIEPSVFISSVNPNPPAPPMPDEDPIAWVNANSDYHLLHLGKPYVNEPGKVAGIETIFSKDGANVLYADGVVMFTSLDELNRLASEQGFELRYDKGFQPIKQ